MTILFYSENNDFADEVMRKLTDAGHKIARIHNIQTQSDEEKVRDMMLCKDSSLFLMDIDKDNGNGPEFDNGLFQNSHNISQLCQTQCLMDKNLIHPHMVILSRNSEKFDFYKTVVHKSTDLEGIRDTEETIQRIIDSIVEH